MESSVRSLEAREAVLRWIEALNARDLERMIACVQPEVEFRPLKLTASRSIYTGYEGLRRWFEEVRDRRHEIQPDGFETLADGRLLALGEIILAGQSGPTSFSGIYLVSDGLISTADHYLSNRDTLERVGALPRR